MYIWIDEGLFPKLETCWRVAPSTKPAEARRPAKVVLNFMLTGENISSTREIALYQRCYRHYDDITFLDGRFHGDYIYIPELSYLFFSLKSRSRLPLWRRSPSTAAARTRYVCRFLLITLFVRKETEVVFSRCLLQA